MKRFNSISRPQKQSHPQITSKPLSKIQNVQVPQSQTKYKHRARFVNYSVANPQIEPQPGDVNPQTKRAMNMSVDDYQTCIKPKVDIGRKLSKVSYMGRAKIRKQYSLGAARVNSHSLNKSVESSIQNEKFQSGTCRLKSQNGKFTTVGRSSDYSSGRSVSKSFSSARLLKSQGNMKMIKRSLTNQQEKSLKQCEQVLSEIGLECFGAVPGAVISKLYYSK